MEADARIDLDMEEILAELTADDLAGAMAKYQGGTNGVQTLASLSKPGATSMASDKWWPVYKDYWNNGYDYADAFVEGLLSLLDADRAAMGERGRSFVEEWVSPAGVAAAYAELFEELRG